MTSINFRYAWFGDIGAGLTAYLLTSALVWLGVTFGRDFVLHDGDRANPSRPDLLTACSRFDALHYAAIIEKGYSYDPLNRSDVAFFPAYPITARVAVALTGWNTRLSLMATSNLMLLAMFVVFSAYLRSRYPEDTSGNRFLVLGIFGLWPAGFFFRMGYSESTFLFFTLLVLYGMVRRWPLLVVILLCGIVTAARPVGLAVTAALVWHIFSDANRGPVPRRLLLAMICSVGASWGLLAYMTYQYYKFNTPLAFAQTQEHWSSMPPRESGLGCKLESLLSWEPLWGGYTSDSIRSWKRFDSHVNPFFSMFFWNPIFFVAALALILVGTAKSWLTGSEIVLSLGLLGIPYVTRAYEMNMASHARFAAIVVPAYLVLGRILRAQPEWLTWAAFGILSVMLMTWSALFSAGYLFF